MVDQISAVSPTRLGATVGALGRQDLAEAEDAIAAVLDLRLDLNYYLRRDSRPVSGSGHANCRPMASWRATPEIAVPSGERTREEMGLTCTLGRATSLRSPRPPALEEAGVVDAFPGGGFATLSSAIAPQASATPR